MHILNLTTKQITKNMDDINLKDDYHFIICNPWELKFFKDTLNLSNEAYKDCLSFDENARVNIYDEYIFFTLANFQINEEDFLLEEINIFLSNKYILIVLRKRNDIYKQIKQLMRENFYYKSNLTLTLFVIYASALRIIISSQFENLEKVEDSILELEDNIINEVDDNISSKISHIRNICRGCVKIIRPLTYIIDTLLKDGMEFFSDENTSLEREYQKLLQGLRSLCR